MMVGDQIQSPAEQRGPASGQRQTHPDSALRRSVRFAPAAEGFEDRSRVTPIDPRAGVDDVEIGFAVVGFQSDEDGSTFRSASMATGVVDQHTRNASQHIDVGAQRLS